jgi:hypothetical protein
VGMINNFLHFQGIKKGNKIGLRHKDKKNNATQQKCCVA